MGVGGVSLGWTRVQGPRTNWRSEISDVLDELDVLGSGLLITVDEVQASFEEPVQLASVYQHLISEGRRVALLMAGLPYQASRILTDKSISFLRRAVRHNLGRIDDLAICDALENTVVSAGRRMSGGSLNCAVDAIEGSPYMMQLVGYRMWAVRPEADEISHDDVRLGIRRATVEMRESVLSVTWDELSERDVAFLDAMMEDAGNSKMADIAARLGVSAGYAAQYRRGLLEAGVIGQRWRGVVGFELPGWREFVELKLAE